MAKSKRIKIKINKAFSNFEKGQVLEVDAFDDGVPTDIFWRRRLNDAERDECCEVVSSGKTEKASRDKPASGGES